MQSRWIALSLLLLTACQSTPLQTVGSTPALSERRTVADRDFTGAGSHPDISASIKASHNPNADMGRAAMLAEGAAESGNLALTFDDGPSLESTPEVLRILAAYNVKATFFLTGSRLLGETVVAQAHRRLAQAIVEQGHLVGNHGLDHVSLSQGTAQFCADQIESSAHIIRETTGRDPHYFRPPFGVLGPVAGRVLGTRGDELALWTLDGHDTIELDPNLVARRLVDQIQFAGQGIVLLHDLRPTSVRTLALLLAWVRQHPRNAANKTGFRVVDLTSYLTDAAKNPYQAPNRFELFRAREYAHRHAIRHAR